MLREIPYHTLKNHNPQAYEILLLRDREDYTFANIAKVKKLSALRVSELYRKIKASQIKLYINHLALVNGHENVKEFKSLYNDIFEWYQDIQHAVAYLEMQYNEILTEYRSGEPGTSEQFIHSLPPFNAKLYIFQIKLVLILRDKRKKTYVEIGNSLHMTSFKAKSIYEQYYGTKSRELVRWIEADQQIKSGAIWNCYFRNNLSNKKRYERILQDFPELDIRIILQCATFSGYYFPQIDGPEFYTIQ